MSSTFKEEYSSTKDTRKEAKKWCEEARNLLKLEKSGKIKKSKKDTFDSRRLDEAIKAVESGLSILESKAVEKRKVKGDKLREGEDETFVKFQELTDEYSEMAKLAKKAAAEKNLDLALTLTDSLNFLEKKIQLAAGNGTDEELEISKQEYVASLRKKFIACLQDAKDLNTELESLAEEPHVFTGEVPEIIRQAEFDLELDNPDLFTDAIDKLGKVESAYNEQLQKHGKYQEYKNESEKTAGLEDEISWVRSKDIVEMFKAVEKQLEVANVQAEKFEYDAAIEEAKKAYATYEAYLKKLPKSERNNINQMLDARKSYLKARKSATDKINEAKKLRGADNDPAVMGHMKAAERILEKADELVDTASSPTNIEKAKQELDTIPDFLSNAKKASAEVKDRVEKDLKYAKDWAKLHLGAKAAHQEILMLAGVDDKRQAFSSKLKLAQDAAAKGLYFDAHELLKDYEKLLDEARKESSQIMSQGLPPDVEQEAKKANQACIQFQSAGQDFISNLNFQELKELTGAIRVDLSNAEKGVGPSISEVRTASCESLKEFTKNVTEEFGRLDVLKREAETSSNRFDELVKQLKSSSFPISDTSEDIIWGEAAKKDMFAKNWSVANERFASVIPSLEQSLKDIQTNGENWKKCESKIKEIRQFLAPFQSWVFMESERNQLMNAIREVESTFAGGGDLEESVSEFGTQKIEELYSTLKTAYSQVDLGKFNTFKEALRLANEEVSNADTSFFLQLAELENQLTGVIDKTTEFHKVKDDAWNEWLAYFRNPSPNDPTKLDPKEITSQKNASLKKYADQKSKLEALLKDKQKLGEFVDEKQKTDAEANLDKLPAKIGEVVRLEKYLKAGQGLSDTSTKLAELTKEKPISEENQKKLIQLYEDANALVKELRQEQRQKAEQALKSLKANEKKIKSSKGVKKDYKAYHEKLVKEIDDIRAMILTGDPKLTEIALQMEKELLEKRNAISDKKADTTYKDADNLIKELSKKCGDSLVISRLPDTQKRNHAMLIQAITKAREASPEEAVKILNDEGLKGAIEQAILDAQKEEDRHAQFEKRKKELEKRWKQVKKVTKTKVTQKAKMVAAYLESRLEEADQVRKAENGLDEAIEIIEKMEKMVDEILEQPDEQKSREKLQEFDAKYEQEARVIRDLARQYEKERDVFKSVTLKNAKKEIASENMDTVNSLEKVVDTSSKLVEPYLKTIATLAIGADKTPDLEKAKSKFESARQQIANAEQTLRRMMSASISTNVEITEDFSKVQKMWQDQSRRFAEETRKLILAINAVKEDDLDGDEKTKAVKTLEKIANKFPADAFAKPFGTLMASSAKKKSEKAEQQKKKLAARETALRTMREFREDLLGHPTLRTLSANEENLVNGQEILAVSGYIRAALKRIEIETLIGV